jgi:hypothetical protein
MDKKINNMEHGFERKNGRRRINNVLLYNFLIRENQSNPFNPCSIKVIILT